MITDEHFRERAAAERANAAGTRPLAHHVRALYEEIRALRADGVGYKYVAAVLIDVREQASCDPIDVTEKIRVYHHRDRKTLGDTIPTLRPAGRAPTPLATIGQTTKVLDTPSSPAASMPTRSSDAPAGKTFSEGLPDVSRAIHTRAARKRFVADENA